MEYNYTLIIPHYNIPKLLRRLLSTVPRRDDMQVIVVDDCSTKELDELEKVRKDYDWVEWYTTGTNGGGGKARNIGLDHAKGKYLIFADADDYFNLCFNEALEKYKNASYDMVYLAANSVNCETYQTCDRDYGITPLINRFLKTNNPKDIKNKFTAPWCRFVSRELINKNQIRFHETIVYNDMWFCLLAEHHSEVICADELAIYCVTERVGSTSDITVPQKEVRKMEEVSKYYAYAHQNKICIAPLWCLIGPMLSALNRKDWEKYEEQAYEPFVQIGVTKRKLRKTLFIYHLYLKLLVPLNNILKELKLK